MHVSLVQRLASLLGALLIGCSSSIAPCVTQEACRAGQTCLAGRCLNMGSELAPSDAQRILVPASEIAVVSSRGNDPTLPSEIPLGRAPNGSIVVLLRFPTPWGNRVRIASAFLTLEPLPGALPETQPVSVSVARVLEPWSASDVSWGRLPRLSAPEVRALASPAPPKTLRIDVTSIVRRWARGRATDQGIALMASGEAAAGATYATGISGAPGPRLDVYVR
ncbi:MAG TPA: DNRLRE domain-containing protein [Polyangiaceae bacterium]